VETLKRNVRIAPLWDNLNTYVYGDTSYDIYVDEGTPGQVTIRWKARNAETGGDVNVSVTLFDDGTFRFDYGAGNTGLTPTIGVSAGNGYTFVLSTYNARADLVSANSVTWAPTPGLTYYDIGAFEFQGDSGDSVPPTVTGIQSELGGLPVSAAPPDTETTALAFRSFLVDFSESLDGISANSQANYELREAGPDPTPIFNNGNDTIYTLTPAYSYPETRLVLEIGEGVLPDGVYRLTLSGTKAIYDTAGNALDGNSDGTGGDDHVYYFKVERGANQPPEAVDQAVEVAEDGSAVITLRATDPDGDSLDFGIAASPSHGTLSSFVPGAEPGTYEVTYTPDHDYNGLDSFTFRVDDRKLGTDEGVVDFTVTPVNDAPQAQDLVMDVPEGRESLVLLPATDVETDRGDLTFTLGTGPDHGTLAQGAGGNWFYTPDAGYVGDDAFTFSVTDRGDPDGTGTNALTSADATVTLHVYGVNEAPSLGPIDDVTPWAGDLDSDGDVDGTDFVAFLGNYGQSGEGLAGDLDHSGTVDAADLVLFSEDFGKIGYASYGITVAEGQTLNYAVPATDPDPGDTLTFRLVSGPVGASIDPASGVLTWTPADGPELSWVTVRVEDQGGLWDEASFRVRVENQAPTLSLWGASTVDAGVSYPLNLSSSDPGDDTILGWIVSWGDGTVEPVPGNPLSITHIYEAPKPWAGDLDADGDVDGEDFASFMVYYQAGSGDSGDLDADGDVDGDDLSIFSSNFGKIGWDSYVITARATDEDGTYDAGSLAVEVTEPGGGAPVTEGMGILSEPEDTATVVVEPQGAPSGEAGAPAGETYVAASVMTEAGPAQETQTLSAMDAASEAAALGAMANSSRYRAGALPAPQLRGESPWAEAADTPRPWELSGDRFEVFGKKGVREESRGDSSLDAGRFSWRARYEDSFWSGKDSSSHQEREEKPWVRRFVGHLAQDNDHLGPNDQVRVELPGKRPARERAVPAWRRWIRK